MAKTVKTAAVQLTLTVGDVQANVAAVKGALARLAEKGCRLAVLPEMWTTGYSYKNLNELAQQTPAIMEEMAELSRRYGMVIVGSVPEPHGDKVCNSAWILDQGRVAGIYRKIHLFSMMQEDRMVHPGDSFLVADTGVGRVGVFICYDLRFPELARRLAVEGAEILAVPAEWPHPREEHWRTLLKARAIENQLYVVAANCCGIQGKLDFCGGSMIIGPKGEVLADGEGRQGEIVADLDFDAMAEWRRQIPCFADRRPEFY